MFGAFEFEVDDRARFAVNVLLIIVLQFFIAGIPKKVNI